jgi:phospholipase D1/2
VPQFRDLTVAVARTEPAFDGDAGVREVEALTLAATAAARRTI